MSPVGRADPSSLSLRAWGQREVQRSGWPMRPEFTLDQRGRGVMDYRAPSRKVLKLAGMNRARMVRHLATQPDWADDARPSSTAPPALPARRRVQLGREVASVPVACRGFNESPFRRGARLPISQVAPCSSQSYDGRTSPLVQAT